MTNTPTKYDDVIDSRDVIARIEELEERATDAARLEELSDCVWRLSDEPGNGLSQDEQDERAALQKHAGPLTPDEVEELSRLRALRDEASQYADDWEHGEVLIRDSYFKDYAQELAEECDMIPADAKWPLTCIDWDQAARELRMDYTSVDFDGVTYWIR